MTGLDSPDVSTVHGRRQIASVVGQKRIERPGAYEFDDCEVRSRSRTATHAFAEPTRGVPVTIPCPAVSKATDNHAFPIADKDR